MSNDNELKTGKNDLFSYFWPNREQTESVLTETLMINAKERQGSRGEQPGPIKELNT